ncbi:repressor LexA [Lacrimispora sphenoides]|uniref:transcriptional repressor LexA n=1 Tax=Lacrimispora sphenoides TaxID=29370 RepID=UPI0008D3715C|nr:transcriptional repressor LexA [Lacrimispora sphenoides]SEU07903.1 repressor LexA [Lacrimispora sphenoides]
MKKLSDKQKLVYDYIKQYVKQNGYPPTVREVADELGKSASTAQFHMQKLEELGHIVRDPAKPRAYELKELNNKTVDIPVLGTVAAGLPLYAEQNIREYFPIPAEIAKGNDYFMLKVKGDSMIKVAIYNGDLILVSRQSYVDNGEIAVVLVNNEATVKRFYKEDGYYRLQPENDLMPPIIVYNAEILGKVVGAFRTM